MKTIIAGAFMVLLSISSVSAQEALPGRLVTVTGEAEVKRAPDKADVSVNISEQSHNAEQAKKLADEKIESLYKIASNLGIAKNDMRTDYSSVQPVYNYTNTGQVFQGYSVMHQVTLTLRDVNKVAVLTEKLIAAKIDQINNVQYGLQKEDEAKDEALKEALVKARRKADMLAGAMRETVDKVYAINEAGVSFQPIPMPMVRGKMAMMEAGVAPAPMMADASANPPSGEMAINASLTATFLLKE